MIAPATLQFLTELKVNNNRDWFNDNKSRYQDAQKNLEAVVAQIIEGLEDEELTDIKPKSCLFRIYRDVRFSKDKSPYKTNMGAHIVKGGKKSGNAGYYMHIQPGELFFGGGMYGPPSKVLAKIRQEIDYNPDSFKKIIFSEEFKAHFGELEGSKLKTAPKGYPKDHPEIALLRFKDFLATKRLDDTVATSSDYVPLAIATFKAMKPLNDFLNQALD